MKTARQSPFEGIPVHRRILRINASTRIDRIEMTSCAERAITESGGWILDFKQFSNVSVCISFEIPAHNLEKLHRVLKAIDLSLTKESDEALSSYNDLQNHSFAGPSESDISATLQITFIHNEPDLRRDVPAIPG
jgi:hypothetical protein